MELKKHRYNRHIGARHENPPSPNLQLRRRLLYKYVQLAWIGQEGNKSRLQFLGGVILSVKKSKTGYLISFYRRGARRVGTKGYLSLRNSSLAFLETPSSVWL